MGAGFVNAISRRWSAPEAEYRAWYRGSHAENGFSLGAVQFVQVEPQLWVANMIGQRGIGRRANRTPPVRYDAIEAALVAVAERVADLGASLHLPRIGTGLAGGRWDVIEPLLVRQLTSRNIDVTVYDLP